jgi:hypothetical protein
MEDGLGRGGLKYLKFFFEVGSGGTQSGGTGWFAALEVLF